MTIDERYKYLRIMRRQYHSATRKERSQQLDQMEQVTGLHRKSLVRHMRNNPVRKPRARQRGKTYHHHVDDALRVIAESVDYICAERLTPYLVPLAQHLARHAEIELGPGLLDELGRISVSTVRRRLQRLARLEQWRVPRRRAPSPPHHAYGVVPMRRIPWDEPQPGHFEVDLVHHCGPSTAGDYVHTVQMVDVATRWGERAAVLGRSQRAMEDAFRRILRRLPFAVLELHPDNGSEFLNDHLLRFWKRAVQGVQLSRSRPFHKNDNRFIEQRNATWVRTYLSDKRFDSVAQARTINLLYDKLWLLNNFFQPVMHLQTKTVSSDHGQLRQRRRYDLPQTPFQRLCAADTISTQKRQELQRLHDQTNPRQLCRDIRNLIDYLFSLPSAVPGVSQNVLETLAAPSAIQKGVSSPSNIIT
jgi:hypothetical protein